MRPRHTLYVGCEMHVPLVVFMFASKNLSGDWFLALKRVVLQKVIEDRKPILFVLSLQEYVNLAGNEVSLEHEKSRD